ncbi:NAD(P)-dependent oxidoreductase [Mycobacterium camsae]|uniref:NAD(P)-dependent oxidoreductase n=1 Tax=Mycobacterium gordonae TaxID=1778 RepID=UPI00198060FB|nr:NAD(P)H-binding protein [Mycobacterium gordonae]
MRVTLLGATGLTGTLLLPMLEREHTVTVLARDVERVGTRCATTRVIGGDATDQMAVTDAVGAADAVITLVAPRRDGDVGTVRSDATKVLLSAVADVATDAHLIVVSALGGAASAGRLSWFGRLVYTRAVGRERLTEVDRQEELIAGCELRITVVRPPRLDDESASTPIEVAGRVGSRQTLHRSDLAHYLCAEVARRPTATRWVTLVSE